MTETLHPAVQLLLARMDSHPEEFLVGTGRDHSAENLRWGPAMSHIRGYGSDADKAAVNAKINVLRMSELHEWLMDELCNGGQRKKKGQRAKPVELGLDWGDT